jgi:hypothetical protein
MSAQTTTLKFKDVNIKLITCESVKMGKDTVPLIRYGTDKKTLFIQGPWIKMRQYGIPAGETLSNGVKNEYYTGEDSRLSVRFPIDVNCCVEIDNTENTNSEEIQEFIKFLQELDAHIKSDAILKSANIDLDDKEKYTPIYRKPAKSKKASNKESSKEKYYSMKTKLDTDGLDVDKKIKTEFYILDKETNQYTLVNTNKYISLNKIEDTLKYNSEVLPIFQFVKIWVQSTGGWGVTLKLKKVRIKNQVYSERGDAIFLDDDNNYEQDKIMPPKPPLTKTKIVDVASDDDSDESDEEQVVKAVANKLNIEDSDSESDEEPVKPKQVKKIVDSDSESDEDVKPKKPVKKVTKSKKASA